MIGDVFCLDPQCSIVGTKEKCGFLHTNSNEEYTYKDWHCSAIVQFVNVPFAEQQLILKLLCESAVYIFEKSILI